MQSLTATRVKPLLELAFGRSHDDLNCNVRRDLHARETTGWLGLPRFLMPHSLWGIQLLLGLILHCLRILLP